VTYAITVEGVCASDSSIACVILMGRWDTSIKIPVRGCDKGYQPLKVRTLTLLVVREHLNTLRSDVSQAGLVQANGEVGRPADGAGNKSMVLSRNKRGTPQSERSTRLIPRRGTESLRGMVRGTQ